MTGGILISVGSDPCVTPAGVFRSSPLLIPTAFAVGYVVTSLRYSWRIGEELQMGRGRGSDTQEHEQHQQQQEQEEQIISSLSVPSLSP